MSPFELHALINATWETIYMVFISSSLSIILGFGVGVFLYFSKTQKWQHQTLHHMTGFCVNSIRSIPFIILLISILPLTRLLVGTSIGTNAAIVPLTLAAIPFFARLTESAFKEVPFALTEMAYSLGANNYQLLFKVLLPESLPSILRAITLTVIGLIGYSAMAGAVGGGGLGELAINYGYQRFNPIVTLETVLILIGLVQLIQLGGDYLALHRRLKPLIISSLVLTLCCISYQVYPLFSKPADVIRVGVISGWSEDVLQTAAKLAKNKYNLTIKIIAFNDYDLPNRALQDGSIDANIFQHIPYLDAQNKAFHYNLVPVAKTFVYPMGFYSKYINTISQLKNNALIALPNDPSNEARALLLLAKYHVIKLKPHIGTNASLQSIISNPKHLQFTLIDAAQVPRALPDVDLAAITNDYLSPAGLSLKKAIIKEGADSAYANVIVVRKNEVNDVKTTELIQVMHSKAVLNATMKIFTNGAAIKAW